MLCGSKWDLRRWIGNTNKWDISITPCTNIKKRWGCLCFYQNGNFYTFIDLWSPFQDPPDLRKRNIYKLDSMWNMRYQKQRNRKHFPLILAIKLSKYIQGKQNAKSPWRAHDLRYQTMSYMATYVQHVAVYRFPSRIYANIKGLRMHIVPWGKSPNRRTLAPIQSRLLIVKVWSSDLQSAFIAHKSGPIQ